MVLNICGKAAINRNEKSTRRVREARDFFFYTSCIDLAFRVPFRKVLRLILLMCNLAPAKGQRPNRTFQLSQYPDSDVSIFGLAISGAAGSIDRS